LCRLSFILLIKVEQDFASEESVFILRDQRHMWAHHEAKFRVPKFYTRWCVIAISFHAFNQAQQQLYVTEPIDRLQFYRWCASVGSLLLWVPSNFTLSSHAWTDVVKRDTRLCGLSARPSLPSDLSEFWLHLTKRLIPFKL